MLYLLFTLMVAATQDATRTLIRQAAQGQRAAQEMLRRRLARVIGARVRRFLDRFLRLRMAGRDAADLYQDIWVALTKEGWKVMLAWEPERGRGLEGYVGMVCERELSHTARSSRTQSRSPEVLAVDGEQPEAAGGTSPELAIVARDLGGRLEKHLMDTLSARDAVILRLLYQDGRKPAQAAKALGVNTQVIYNVQHHIRRLSADFLREYDRR